jgi:diazepam-binding inhibitor (GABA receptor modulator, acyl-CoA-binding protein)
VRECPNDATLLKQYALYKQATAGDIAGSRPGISDTEGCAKYDAWEKLKGTTKTEAMNHYIALIESLKVDLSTYSASIASSPSAHIRRPPANPAIGTTL